MTFDPNAFPLRNPCVQCGGELGHIVVRNGQNTVRCNGCDTYAGFNAPKSETGETQRSVRSRPTRRPSDRARVLLRDGYRCVLCGKRQGDDVIIVEGHLISRDIGKQIGLSDDEIDHDENLAAMCEECNSGLSSEPVPMPTMIAVLRARISWRKNRGEA